MAEKRKSEKLEDVVEQEIKLFKKNLLKRLLTQNDEDESVDSAWSDSDEAVRPKTSVNKLKGSHLVRSIAKKRKHYLDSDSYSTDEEKKTVISLLDTDEEASNKTKSSISIKKLFRGEHDQKTKAKTLGDKQRDQVHSDESGEDATTLELLRQEYQNQCQQVRQLQSELNSRELEVKSLKLELEQSQRTVNELLEDMQSSNGGIVTLN